MKNILIAVFILSILATARAEEKVQLKDTKDKVSYSIGLNIGSNMKRQGVDVNPSVFAAGVKDALSGATPLMTDQQIKETMTAFAKEMSEKEAAATKDSADKNTAAGDKFLADNKKKPGVKTTADGLQYKVLREGNGSTPKATDTVQVNYRGSLINGTEFDSSYKRGEPATFPVNGVIKGWTEALQLMKVGSKYQLVIPADLAYGARGAGQDIGPNSTLIFEVELLKIQPSATPAASGTPAP